MSDKLEYFAVRNCGRRVRLESALQVPDHRQGRRGFLAGVLARDIRQCPPATRSTPAGSTTAGSSSRTASSCTRQDEYLLTSAEPNFAYFADRIGRLDAHIEEVSQDIGTLALQGPRSRDLLKRLVPQMESIPYFGIAKGEIGGAAVTVSRTGYSGDLGYEVWVDTPDALHVWDTMWDSMAGYGVQPFGLAALYMLRIEAGLLLLEADFDSSRYAWNDAHRSTPIELGWSWMFKDLGADDRPFIGRRALEREIADKTSRWAMRGLIVDWQDYDRVYNEAGLIPPKDHAPVVEDWMSTTTTTSASATPRASCTRRCSSATSPSPGPPGLREARDQGEPRVHRRPPLRAGRRARRPAAALQPGAKDGLT
jgi:aminomethyltransferase